MMNSTNTYLKVLVMSLLRQLEASEADGGEQHAGTGNLQREVHRFEAELIRNALIQTGGRQRRAARLLGVKVTTLNAKIKRYQISVEAANLNVRRSLELGSQIHLPEKFRGANDLSAPTLDR